MKKTTARRTMKLINGFVAILMLLQPVGAPGILTAMALAEDSAVQSVDSQTPSTVAEEETSADASNESENDEPEEDSAATDTDVSDEPNAPSETDEADDSGDASEAAVTVSPEQSSDVESNNPLTLPTIPLVEQKDAVPGETGADTSNSSTGAGSPAISTEAASTEAPVTEEKGKICLAEGAKIVSSGLSDWNVNGDTAETKNKVELGVKYVFPGNDKVSVTFTCLPASSDERTTLKIEQIETSEMQLPSNILPAYEYAYDITTGMKDGDFEYDLTLPKADVDGADVNYIEKTADEVQNQGLSSSDLKSIEDSKVKEGTNNVKVEELDHFTVFVVTISSGPVTFTLDGSDCEIDTAGANDEPGQKDLSRMCADYSDVPTILNVGWNWDDTAWSGNNTGDGCSLFDTDGDGYANYSLCVTVSGDPATFSSKILYSCNDTRSDRCAGPSAISSSADTNCTAFVDPSDPFTLGTDYPNDTAAGCQIKMSDIGGGVSAELIDVCSYPSREPNSDPSDCIIALTSNKSGKLEVKKLLSPSNDTGKFNLQIDGATYATDIGNGGTTGEKTVAEGTHTVGELAGTGTLLSNYTSSIACKDNNGTGSIVASSSNAGPLNVDVADGDDIICTITNTLRQGTIIVNKIVTNDDGGTATAADFQAKIDGNNVAWGVANEYAPGTYTVTETGVSGYLATFSDDCGPTGQVVLGPGEDKVCTITNDDQQGALIVKKVVINDNGGTKIATDFAFSVDGGNATAFLQDADNLHGKNNLTVDAGTYDITEPAVTGYTTTYNNCSDVVVPNGGLATCTITNNDIQPKLTVTKIVVNDNGGTKTILDFPLFVGSTAVLNGVQNGFDAGNYAVSETSDPGYSATISGDCMSNGNITLDIGDIKSCTITNDDIQPKLTVIKHVENDNGGEAAADDFSMNVSGNSPSPASFPGDENGTLVALNAGSYNVGETGPSGYASSFSVDCSGTVAVGDVKVCTVTNDDQAPKLTIIKTVLNNNGGIKTVSDFPLFVNGIPVTSGVQNTLIANVQYTASENPQAGYAPSVWGGDCAADGTITLLPGDNKTCTITNDDVSPTLTLIKTVVNDDGGIKQVSDFPLFIDGLPVASGVATQVPANALHVASETSLPGYIPSSWSGDCAADGSITLQPGENKTCGITNDDVAPKLTILKSVITDNGGNANPDDFDLTVGGTGVLSGVENTYAANTPLTIDETQLMGYNFVSITGDPKCPNALGGTITLDEGDDITCTITNDDISPTITLIKTVIGGSAGPDEFGISVGGNNVLSGAITNVDANSAIPINETGKDGYTFTSINGDPECPDALGGTVTLDEGENVTCTITNTRDTGSITITKIIDVDGDLGTTNDQTPFEGWVMDVDPDGPDTDDPSIPATDASGQTSASNIKTGNYWVIEEDKLGYEVVSGSCTLDGQPTGNGGATSSFGGVEVAKGKMTFCTFYNTPNGTIHGYKWEDIDSDGQLNGEELKLSGWTINLYGRNGETYDTDPIKTMDTDAGSGHFGWYWFEHLFPGQYKVCEVIKDGWDQTYPLNENGNCHFLILPDDNSNGFPESYNYVAGPEYNFGNHFIPPELTIEKFNSQWPTVQDPGDVIDYTITVRASKNNVNGVVVTDLPPEGFEYLPGSAVASSSLGAGHIGALSLSHAYASPGEWSLGDMQMDEEITLTYKAKISSSQQPGTYNDLAWADGTSDINERVLATSVPAPTVDDGVITENFVGTQIALVVPGTPQIVELDEDTETRTRTKERTREITTFLPATGFSPWWILAAALILLAGAGLLYLGQKKERRQD